MLTIDGIQITDEIGCGSFGRVYRCKIKDMDAVNSKIKTQLKPDRELAGKIINIENMSSRLEKITQREIEICLKMDHKNVIKGLYTTRTDTDVYLFFDYCNGGDLKHFIKVYKKYEENDHPNIDEKIVQSLASQIANGLVYLYNTNIVHRDIKLENILLHFPDYKNDGTVSNDYLYDFDPEFDIVEVVISDLGLARELDNSQGTRSVLGTPITMAPEIHNHSNYNHSVDIWSLGVIVFELYTGGNPFGGFSRWDIAKNINSGIIEIPKQGSISKEGLNFLKCGLKHDANNRLSHKELLSHPFVQNKMDKTHNDLIDTSIDKRYLK